MAAKCIIHMQSGTDSEAQIGTAIDIATMITVAFAMMTELVLAENLLYVEDEVLGYELG